MLILIFISVAFPQRDFAKILYVKYADVILMMGINCLTEVLIDILCLDCGLLNVRVNLFFTSSYEGCVLKGRIFQQEYMPAGQVEPNIITVFDKKELG